MRKFQSIPPVGVVADFIYTDMIYIYTYLEVLRINANLNHQRRGWSSQQHTANNDDDDDLNFI